MSDELGETDEAGAFVLCQLAKQITGHQIGEVSGPGSDQEMW
jgi:hypothetical protein